MVGLAMERGWRVHDERLPNLDIKIMGLHHDSNWCELVRLHHEYDHSHNSACSKATSRAVRARIAGPC